MQPWQKAFELYNINRFIMVNKIVLIAVFVVIGLMTYNYFLGSARQKEQAQEIFIKGTEVIDASARLLKTEYEKFNNENMTIS